MQLLDGELVLSPSDLTGFAACTHLTQLELAAARRELERPDRHDPELEVLAKAGEAHEARQLDLLRSQGRSVVEILADGSSRSVLLRAEADTLAAMRAGTDVIYQATFFDGTWLGHADFLLRVDAPSDLGAWSYEVADAKLARRVRAAALLQMCAYSKQVERLQGLAPRQMHVVTGDGEQRPFRVADYAAYFRALEARYEALVLGAPVETYPDPVEHCGICRWADRCDRRRRDDDHLCLVAGMRRDQTRKLVAAGIRTTTDLAATDPDTRVTGVGGATFERLRRQADLQAQGAGRHPPLYALLPPDADAIGGQERGLASLPAPSPGDLFFDMEGDPFALDGGIEYLFGVVEVADGTPTYRALWAHDRAGEKQAFEGFVDLVTARLEQDPALHVYHYAPYEPSAVRRLMGAHGTREAEVDALLRGEVFVDLYRVLRQSVQVSTESYSLKDVEQLYMQRPAGAVMDAGSSIVAYESYLETGDESRLREITDYNRDDCESTLRLRDWLEDRRDEACEQFGAIARPCVRDPEPTEVLAAREAELAVLEARLCADVADDPEERDDEQQARWLLAQLLYWHRREDKPDWWAFYHRIHDLSGDDFVDDPECLGGLQYVGVVERVKRSDVHRYRFEPQDHKFAVGNQTTDPATAKGAGTVVAVDDERCTIDLSRAIRHELPHPHALIPAGPIDNAVLRDAIVAAAEWVVQHGIDASGPYRAARDLLLRREPRIRGTRRGAPIARDGEKPLAAACRVVLELDDTCLAVHGPPGSGKTYTGAHMIVDLLRAGRSVGITAHTHTAIGNLLSEVCACAQEAEVTFDALQKADEHQHCGDDAVAWTTANEDVEAAVAAGSVNVVAGTAWLWAREGMHDAVDALFVDEAGQMSLADVVVVSRAARSLVLLGDPQQLAQPGKGSHPPGAEASALQHLLGEHETMPAHLGLFLDTTHRMHPDVCAFVSEVAYEGRLHSEQSLERQRVTKAGEALLAGSGLRFVPVEHIGRPTASPEEAHRVAELVDALVGGKWINKKDEAKKLTLDDVLVVAPYNAHVARLRQQLPRGARVGTVDKFQGQQAPVAIYSMATSSADDLARTMEFLYDLHRLNVAVSRARSLAVLVCSPELLRVHCRTPQQMRLANALCRFVERSP